MKKSMFKLIINVIAYSIIFTSFSFAAEDLTIVNKNTDNPTIYYKGNSWLGTGPIDEHRIFNWQWESTWFDHKSWFGYMENNKFNFGRAYAMSGWPYYDHKKDPANRIFPFKVDHWNDDDPVVDLLQMDATYWSNFSRVLQEAEDREIIICIQLYQKHQFNGNFRTELFFHRDNNINGVNTTDNTIWKAMSNAYPNGILWKTHRNWVNQILDAIGTKKNVIIDLMNEPDIKTISKEWVDRTLDLIEAWESANSRDILVGMDIDHVLARDSQADIAWVLGHPRMELIVGEDHWIYDQTSLLINHRKENKKPLVWVNEKKNGYMDTRILSDSPNRRRHYLWLGMMTKIQGLGLYDKKNHTQEGYLSSLQATELGNYNKILFNFFENTIADYSGLNVATDVIDSAPSSDSKVCLSSSDEVVVYLHKGFGLSQGSGATLKLKNLSLPNGDVNITFFHPENGNASSLTKNFSGTNLDVTLPEYTENIAVYIKPSGISEDPPTITSELQDQTVTVGQTATFKVTAKGTTPLSYQWQKNNVDIADASNSPTYITPIATLADNGNQYRCIVTNDYGTATSNNAALTVTEPSGNDYFVETSGQVVMEAENYDQSNINGDSGGEWNNNTSPPSGAVGDSMQAPNAAAASWSNGAELVYNIKFNNAGNYNVWLRRWADKGGKNSCFKGYDGSQVGGTIDNGSPSTNWVWVNGGTISVSSTGVHTLSIRRREKLYQIDRIVINTASVVPSGSGPAESPRDGGIVTTYALSVVNGSGDGDYEESAVISISADAPPTNQQFNRWTGDVTYVTDINNPATTISMPAQDITVTATYTVGTVYSLTVNNGSGDGSYAPGTVVNIEADSPPQGQEFDIWTGDVAQIADINSASTTMIMPAGEATVSATYRDIQVTEYALTVNNGTGDGNYTEGTVVNISADIPPAGQVFDKWIGDVAGVTDLNVSSTTLTMPAGNTTVTATYREAAGNDYFVENSGQVVMEAENYDQSNVNGDSGGKWNNNTSPPSGAVGDSMQAPNAAAASWSNGAELVYNIKFNNTGNYNVWLRRWADKGGKNSCFKGYDGSQVGGTIDNSSPSTNWSWIDGGAISVSSTGVHTLNIRRREKLYQIDRIVLKTASGAPSGSGPAESPRDGGIITTYALSVVNGSGNGDYEEGAVVYIEPDNPPAGQEFDIWTGDVAYVADVNAYSTTVTMPASNIMVTATFRDTQVTQYFLTVNNGSGDGSYTEGTVVNIEADAPHAGQVFNNWSGDVADVADPNNSNTTINMPGRDVTVTATYDDILGETKYSIESTIAGKNNPDPVAFDNDIVTRWQSNNNDDSNWAEFNLGSNKQVTKIRIYHDYGSNLTGIDLKVDEVSKWSGTLNKDQWEEIVLSGERGQKIKLDRNSSYRLRINEIEIYGISSAQ